MELKLVENSNKESLLTDDNRKSVHFVKNKHYIKSLLTE